MAYVIILPEDTQNEIDEFLEARCENIDIMVQVASIIDREMDKIAGNPTLGAVRRGTPFGKRRIHRFQIQMSGQLRTAELAYRINDESHSITFSGFEERPIVL